MKGGCITNTTDYKRGAAWRVRYQVRRYTDLIHCVYTYAIYINVCRRYAGRRKEAVGKIASAMRDLPLPCLRGCPLGGSRPRGQPSSSFITGLGLAIDVGRRPIHRFRSRLDYVEVDRLKRYLYGCPR